MGCIGLLDMGYHHFLFGCLDCKKILAEKMEEVKGPIRERAKTLRADPAALDRLLDSGAEKARAVAAETMQIVRDRVGIHRGATR